MSSVYMRWAAFGDRWSPQVIRYDLQHTKKWSVMFHDTRAPNFSLWAKEISLHRMLFMGSRSRLRESCFLRALFSCKILGPWCMRYRPSAKRVTSWIFVFDSEMEGSNGTRSVNSPVSQSWTNYVCSLHLTTRYETAWRKCGRRVYHSPCSQSLLSHLEFSFRWESFPEIPGIPWISQLSRGLWRIDSRL